MIGTVYMENEKFNYNELTLIYRGLLLLFAKSNKRLNNYIKIKSEPDEEMLNELTKDKDTIKKLLDKIYKLEQQKFERNDDI